MNFKYNGGNMQIEIELNFIRYLICLQYLNYIYNQGLIENDVYEKVKVQLQEFVH